MDLPTRPCELRGEATDAARVLCLLLVGALLAATPSFSQAQSTGSCGASGGGSGAIVLDGAVIGERSIIGAGALVTGGTIIPPGSLVLGSPAKVVKTLSLDEQAKIRLWADKYVKGSCMYRGE